MECEFIWNVSLYGMSLYECEFIWNVSLYGM